MEGKSNRGCCWLQGERVYYCGGTPSARAEDLGRRETRLPISRVVVQFSKMADLEFNNPFEVSVAEENDDHLLERRRNEAKSRHALVEQKFFGRGLLFLLFLVIAFVAYRTTSFSDNSKDAAVTSFVQQAQSGSSSSTSSADVGSTDMTSSTTTTISKKDRFFSVSTPKSQSKSSSGKRGDAVSSTQPSALPTHFIYTRNPTPSISFSTTAEPTTTGGTKSPVTRRPTSSPVERPTKRTSKKTKGDANE